MDVPVGAFGVYIDQNFNSESSITVTGIYANLSTIPAHTWVKIAGTATLPSTAGKTINAGSFLAVNMYLPSQAGLISNTAEWQLEEGSVATPFEHRPYGLELALCQRYFERVSADGGRHNIGTGSIITPTTVVVPMQYAVKKRVIPSVSIAGATNGYRIINAATNGFALTNLVYSDGNTTSCLLTGTSSGMYAGQACLVQTGDGSSAYIDISAEL